MARTHQASNNFLNTVGTRETRVETAKKRATSIEQRNNSSNFAQTYNSIKREKSYRQDFATTQMNETAPNKYNRSTNSNKKIPDVQSFNDFYKKRKPSPTRRISLSITGANEQNTSPMT